MDFKKFKDDLLFVPLGGSNEIGMNLNLYRYKGKWIMCDLGIGFAGPHLPGIDIMLPNIDAITPFKNDIVGLVLTHAHEDHLGAVATLWPELGCPIYATPFTAAFLRHKISEMGPGPKPQIIELKPGGATQIGPFGIELVELTHSIPEMQAVAITTPKGVVMHTGDWKLDANPMVGVSTDEATLAKYGDEGVLAMVCDSTNVFVEGESGSEEDVRATLADVIRLCPERAIVTSFSSNIARIESIIYAARDAGREVAIAGKSIWRMVHAAQEAGYLKDVPNFLTDTQGMELPRNKVVFICTGCQGESRAALSKIARGEHPGIRLSPVTPANDVIDAHPQPLFEYVVRHLAPLNLAYLHVIEGSTGGPRELPDRPFDYAELRNAYRAAGGKGAWMVNNAYDRALAEAALANGADIVAFGRPFISNPDLVERLKQNAPLNELNRDTLYGGGAKGYTDYPTLAG